MSEKGPLINARNIEALKYYSGDQIQIDDDVRQLKGTSEPIPEVCLNEEQECFKTPGCVLKQGGGGVFHRSCDCATVEDLQTQIRGLQQDAAVRDVQIRDLKIHIYDLIYGDE